MSVWTPEEQAAWKLPENITVSEWADRERVVSPLVSPEPGPWKTSRVPYMRAIMDAFSDPLVEEITIMAASQVAKTESFFNMVGYAIDQDPGPALIVFPSEDLAASTSANRIKPMIEQSPSLARHLKSEGDEFTKLEYRLKNMIVYFAGANSPASLSSRAIRYLFLDEVDKFPRFSGKEADPIKLAGERTKNFWNRKIIKVSTPTTADGFIYREYNRSTREVYQIPCPHCGAYQELKFAQIKWPKKVRDPNKILDDRLAWYECEHCQDHIRDSEKIRVMGDGIWTPDGWTVDKNGELNGYIRSSHRGFTVSALYSPWLTWDKIAAEWLGSHKRPELKLNFINSWLAEIHQETIEETDSIMVDSLISEYPEGYPPEGSMVLTAGVDVQKDHFWFVIRAWALNEESFLIRCGRVESWAEVTKVLFKTQYQKPNGENLGVRLACIDSNYRTDEVYEYCRKSREIARPIRGQRSIAGVPYRSTRIDRNPRTGEIIKGGLLLWNIDTSHYKDKISRMTSPVESEDGSGKWHLYAGISDQYKEQFCSEHKVKEVVNRKTGADRTVWKKKPGVIDNHLFDCEVYSVSAADMLRVAYMTPDEGDQNVYRPNRKPPSSASGARGGGEWMRKKNNWL